MRKIIFKRKKLLRTRQSISNRSFFVAKWRRYSKIFNEQIANNLVARLLDSSNTKKSFDWWVCLTIPARTANLLPPVGPFLGQHGFNTPIFCANFNTITKNLPESLPLKVYIKLYTDKTIQLQIWTPSTSFLLYSSYNNNNLTGVSLEDLYKIAYIKWIDNYDLENESFILSIIGTMRSMKIKILEDEDD
mgnify:CR=1 FL=1